jgi:hypothetical protein
MQLARDAIGARDHHDESLNDSLMDAVENLPPDDGNERGEHDRGHRTQAPLLDSRASYQGNVAAGLQYKPDR